MKPRVFWSRVLIGDGCWEWTGYQDQEGYSKYGGRLAHRLMYELMVGPVPSGLSIDHLCRNPGCVNPDHLEAVPLRENILRGKAGEQARQAYCLRGHPFDEANTYRNKGKRFCRACGRRSTAAYLARKKERAA